VPLALFLLGLQLGQPLCLGRAALGFLGSLLDLAQPILGVRHRLLMRFAFLLQALLRGPQVGRGHRLGGRRRRWRRRWRRDCGSLLNRRRLPQSGSHSADPAAFGLALQALGFGDAAIGLGADPLLLALYFTDLGLDSLLDGGRLLISERSSRRRRLWRSRLHARHWLRRQGDGCLGGCGTHRRRDRRRCRLKLIALLGRPGLRHLPLRLRRFLACPSAVRPAAA
jgi:hypothetical protein